MQAGFLFAPPGLSRPCGRDRPKWGGEEMANSLSPPIWGDLGGQIKGCKQHRTQIK
jgi:hypothetical protein